MIDELHEEQKSEKAVVAERLERDLKLAAGLRRNAAADPVHASERNKLREWQAARLGRTYPDLLGSSRFGSAATFFLSDLYGTKDFSARDTEIERILPMLVKALPLSALETIALAIELDALSEDLDARMVDALRSRGEIDYINDDTYAAAYCTVGKKAARLRQIQLIVDTGEALDRLARKPIVTSALRLMRGPAHLAGLGELQDFLERGFTAFRDMGKADMFLSRIETEETKLMAEWFAA